MGAFWLEQCKMRLYLYDEGILMKQMRWVLFITAVLLLAAACGGTTEPETAVSDTASLPNPPTPEPPTLPPPPVVVVEAGGGNTAVDPGVNDAKTGPWPADRFGYGIQIHGNATVGDPISTMDSTKNQLGLDWVKMQVQWWLVKPEPDADQWFFYDGVINEAANFDLNLMVSVVGAPSWTRAAGNETGPPDDFNEYARFLTELIARHPGKIDAIEVWNEQNLDREWQTDSGINPEEYVRFLQVAYDAIKTADPDIIVISGALAPTGTGDWIRWADDSEYLDRALAAGMLNYADCVGVHHNGYNIGPDIAFDQTSSAPDAATAQFRGPFDNPHRSWSFKTTLDTYAQKVQAIDPAVKLCVTEFGWASSEGYDAPPEGFEFALDNTLQEQADYIVQAYQQMYASGDVWLAFMFNYDFGNKGSGPQDDPVPYSIVDINGIPRPAYGAIANMEKPD
jgi:polysaccharide biosynthesis protein PslG